MKLKYLLCVCVVLLLVISCAKPPEDEVQEARNKVFEAQTLFTKEQYDSSYLDSAKRTLKEMEDAYNSKRYDDAKRYANNAITAANKAIDEAAAKKKNEAATVITGLKPEIEETSRNVNGARYSLLDLDYDALDDRIVNAYDTSDQAEVDLAFGKYKDAIDKAADVRSDLSSINNMVSNAVVRKKG
jgi:hypothetical protein